MKSNQYEFEIDQLLKRKNLDYYNGLKRVLSEYQKELISTGILKDSTYQAFANLLKIIAVDGKTTYTTSYDLKASHDELGEGIRSLMPSIEHSLIAKKYLNNINSKVFIYNQKISETIQKKQKLNRSILANILLAIYDEKDFELLLVKLKFFRFLDPNTNFVVYSFAGKPDSE